MPHRWQEKREFVLADGQLLGVVFLTLALFLTSFVLGYVAGARQGHESEAHAISTDIPGAEVLRRKPAESVK